MEEPPTSAPAKPEVLFLGKRFYTNRDALEERYGRIYQLPHHWAESGINTRLWLIDYHGRQTARRREGALAVSSLPLMGLGTLQQLFSKLMIGRRHSHVVATGDCYIGLLGYAVAKRIGAKFIFDVYDKYDDFGGYRRLPGIDPFSFLLQRADRRLFASHALLERLGQPEQGDLLVANGLDRERFRSLDMITCREALGLPIDIRLIGYFGSMEPDRGVTDLIEAVALLRGDGVAVELLIGGRAEPSIDLDAPGVRYMGNVPFHEVPRMLGACDLLAVPYRRSSFMDAGASNKIAEALACNRPIVATRTPNLVANFPEIAGLLGTRLAPPHDTAALAGAIRLQLADPLTAPLPPGWEWESIARETARRLGLASPTMDCHQ